MKLFPALFVILFITSCKDQTSQSADNTNTTGKDSTTNDSANTYLPIKDLIQQDLKRVDSFAGGLLRKATMNGKKDSAFVKPAAFHEAANAFLIPELEATAFRQAFTENSLMDETTQQLQFIYTPKNPAVTIRNAVVYVTPSTSGDNVSRIYLEKEWAAGDTLVHQKLTWKMRQYFYIITIREPKQGPPSTSIEKLIWDPEQFGQ